MMKMNLISPMQPHTGMFRGRLALPAWINVILFVVVLVVIAYFAWWLKDEFTIAIGGGIVEMIALVTAFGFLSNEITEEVTSAVLAKRSRRNLPMWYAFNIACAHGLIGTFIVFAMCADYFGWWIAAFKIVAAVAVIAFGCWIAYKGFQYLRPIVGRILFAEERVWQAGSTHLTPRVDTSDLEQTMYLCGSVDVFISVPRGGLFRRATLTGNTRWQIRRCGLGMGSRIAWLVDPTGIRLPLFAVECKDDMWGWIDFLSFVAKPRIPRSQTDYYAFDRAASVHHRMLTSRSIAAHIASEALALERADEASKRADEQRKRAEQDRRNSETIAAARLAALGQGLALAHELIRVARPQGSHLGRVRHAIAEVLRSLIPIETDRKAALYDAGQLIEVEKTQPPPARAS